MAWEKVNIMFPAGRVPNDINLTTDILIKEGFEKVSFDAIKKAREMVIQKDRYTWDKNNNFNITNLYNVYRYPCVDGTPYLSVYGARMLLDFKQKIAEEKENVRFNYTGL